MDQEESTDRRIELNGRNPGVDELAWLGQVNYGHFTTMQVRDGWVRGFELHLQRLAHATRILFDRTLDVDQVRAWARGIVADRSVSLRITVFSMAFDQGRGEHASAVDVLMATRAPRLPRAATLRLRSVRHERVLPQIKHIGMFDLLYHARAARVAGYDDVLLTTNDGEIAEGSTWNIGFWDGQQVIWPTAPALPGITQKLLNSGLRANGVETMSRPVHLHSLAGIRSAFILNSGSLGPMIESIDSQRLAADADLPRILAAAHDSQSLEKI
ncbi:MAG TPA: aminotransferase class IV [Dokdonella sp.]|uniref:aminotransferase class IV n=1 Tax=Dokdonella sp. TaxID=2291710 RepID=UPI002D7F00E8|nr:aminotransferase class IV [Dokdonella sp.]HET9031683.1 aminotransferase class IV [Dokdonella sp.]